MTHLVRCGVFAVDFGARPFPEAPAPRLGVHEAQPEILGLAVGSGATHTIMGTAARGGERAPSSGLGVVTTHLRDICGNDDLKWPHRDAADSSERRNAEIDRGVRWTWWNKAMGIIGGMFLRGSVSSS